MKTTAQVGVDNKTDYTLEKHSSYNSNLEWIRGLAALSVASLHILGQKNYLDPTYHPNIYFGYLQAAHSAVLLFFVLSGYVIGLTTTKDYSNQELGSYRTHLVS